MTEGNTTTTELDLSGIRAVERVGDLIIDQDSGEILEWPVDLKVDRWEWLARQAAETTAQEKAWKAAGGFFRRLLLGYLEAEQLDRYTGADVKFARRNGQDRRWADPAKLDEVKERYELTRSQLIAIRSTANRYNKKNLQALEERGKIPKGTTEALLSGTIGDPFVVVDRVKKQAPAHEISIQESD